MAKRSLKQRQRSLTLAYNKAVKEISTLQRQGFRIKKSVLKALSPESLSKKSAKAAQKDINYYKSFSKKSTLYSKASSYITDKGKKVSVAQGKQAERAKSKQTTKYTNIELVRSRLKELTPQVTSSKRKGGLYQESKEEDISSDISEVLSQLYDIEELGSDISEETANYVIEQIDTLSHYKTIYNADVRFTNIKRALQSYLNDENVSANISEEEFSTINTPYEIEDIEDFE